MYRGKVTHSRSHSQWWPSWNPKLLPVSGGLNTYLSIRAGLSIVGTIVRWGGKGQLCPAACPAACPGQVPVGQGGSLPPAPSGEQGQPLVRRGWIG